MPEKSFKTFVLGSFRLNLLNSKNYLKKSKIKVQKLITKKIKYKIEKKSFHLIQSFLTFSNHFI